MLHAPALQIWRRWPEQVRIAKQRCCIAMLKPDTLWLGSTSFSSSCRMGAGKLYGKAGSVLDGLSPRVWYAVRQS